MENTQRNLASVHIDGLLEAVRRRCEGERNKDTARLDYVLGLINSRTTVEKLDRQKVDVLMEMKESGIDLLGGMVDASWRGRG